MYKNKIQNLALLHAACNRVLHSTLGLPERKTSLLKSFSNKTTKLFYNNKSFSNKKTKLFNNNKRYYVKKYFYGYLAGMTNNNTTFKYLKNSLNHTCFYAKDVKGVDQKGNIYNFKLVVTIPIIVLCIRYIFFLHVLFYLGSV